MSSAIPSPPEVVVPLWFQLLQQFDAADGVTILISLIALILSYGALRLAKRQVVLAEEQTALSRKQSEYLDTQLARRAKLAVFVRGREPHVIESNGRPVSRQTKYLLGIRNDGTRTVNSARWLVHIADDTRLKYEFPHGHDSESRWKQKRGGEDESFAKMNGVVSEQILEGGGVADMIWFTVHGPGLGPVEPKVKWFLRCEDGRFPAEGYGTLDLSRVVDPEDVD